MHVYLHDHKKKPRFIPKLCLTSHSLVGTLTDMLDIQADTAV